MHYEVRYDRETIKGRNKAVADVVEWLGEARAELVGNAIKSGQIETMDQLRLALSFAGVTGFPVVAFGERHGLYE
jgi:hypothetical protein